MGIKISGNKISANSKDTPISYASILNSGVGGVSTQIQVPQSATAEIPSENFITITCNGGPAASQQINPNISGCKIDFKTLEVDKEYIHKLTQGEENISGATIRYTIEVRYRLTNNNVFNIRFENTLYQSSGSLSLGFNDKTMVINDYTPAHVIEQDLYIKGRVFIEEL
jgi:hypothetical protein